MPEQTVRDALMEAEPSFLATVALQGLHGRITAPGWDPGKCGREQAILKNSIFAWALRDDATTRRQWSALKGLVLLAAHEDYEEFSGCLGDRDFYVERFWDRVAHRPAEQKYPLTKETTEDPQKDFRSLLTDLGAMEAYQRNLFDWFLRRFHLRAALKVAGSPFGAGWLLLTVLVLSVALVVAATGVLGLTGPGSIAAGLVGLATLALVAWQGARLPLDQAAQVLFPRLAAGIAVGYLFLAAAAHLVGVIAGEPWFHALLLAFLLLALTFAYTAFHVTRRVHPQLPWRSLFWRTGGLFSMGVAYAALGLPLFVPLFTLPRFHGGATVTFGPANLALLAAVALALGMVLELAWEEKPLTEPL